MALQFRSCSPGAILRFPKSEGTFIFLRLRPFHQSRPTMRMNDMGGMQMKNDRE
jgi:hypothetical protein